MKIFLVIFSILSACAAQTDVILNAFNNWTTKYNKKYANSNDKLASYSVFGSTYMAASRQQLKFFNGQSKFLMKTNNFAAQNSSQRSGTRGFIPDPELDFTVGMGLNGIVEGRNLQPVYPPPPPSLDYRTMGYVTAVKDQGATCASCYAFAATCALEGQIAKKFGKLVDLSEQNIVDCTVNATLGNYGCNGGSVAGSLKYVVKNPGIANATLYPYVGAVQTCAYNSTILAETALSYFYVTGNETYLKSALAAIGPLAIGVRGDLDSFAYYGSGIYDDLACDAIINHAVCLVGYGTDNSTTPPTNYWIAKNSWSVDWGEGGYIRIQMGLGLCGITSYTVSARV